jgi:hypothetical protein
MSAGHSMYKDLRTLSNSVAPRRRLRADQKLGRKYTSDYLDIWNDYHRGGTCRGILVRPFAGRQPFHKSNLRREPVAGVAGRDCRRTLADQLVILLTTSP